MKTASILALLLLGSLLAAAQTTTSKKPTGPAAQLPPRVLNGFQKDYPQAHILKVRTEMYRGDKAYEIESEDQGVRRDCIYSDYGVALEIEEAITPNALPAGVQDAIRMSCLGCSILKAEKVTRGSSLTYEVTLRGRRGRSEVAYTPDGSVVTTKK